MTTLKPCPFCGFTRAYIDVKQDQFLRYHPRCMNCECTLYWYKTEKEAVEAWNTRKISYKERQEMFMESINEVITPDDSLEQENNALRKDKEDLWNALARLVDSADRSNGLCFADELSNAQVVIERIGVRVGIHIGGEK